MAGWASYWLWGVGLATGEGGGLETGVGGGLATGVGGGLETGVGGGLATGARRWASCCCRGWTAWACCAGAACISETKVVRIIAMALTGADEQAQQGKRLATCAAWA